MGAPHETYNGGIEKSCESKQSDIDSTIKSTRFELIDFQSTFSGGQTANHVEKVNEPEWETKAYIKSIIEESISAGKLPLIYTPNIGQTLTDYIIFGKPNMKSNMFLDFQLSELIKNPQNWKGKYILDNPQKPLIELINNIKKKYEVMELFNKHTQYDSIINKYSDKYNVDPLLIKSIINKESQFNPKAISPAGAKGLMQLMPITEKEVNRIKKGTITDVYNPQQNIEGGTMIFSSNLKKFNGNISHALIAYNWGGGHLINLVEKVARYLNITKEKLLKNDELFYKEVFHRLPKETKKYVNSIMSTYKALSI